jgi:hypothetical protein
VGNPVPEIAIKLNTGEALPGERRRKQCPGKKAKAATPEGPKRGKHGIPDLVAAEVKAEVAHAFAVVPQVMPLDEWLRNRGQPQYHATAGEAGDCDDPLCGRSESAKRPAQRDPCERS